MSRSKRKTPIVGMTTAKSDKPFKKAEHQRERSQVKAKLDANPDDLTLPGSKAYGNPWSAGKDGKQYLGKEPAQLAIAKRIAKGSDAADKKRVVRALKKLTAK